MNPFFRGVVDLFLYRQKKSTELVAHHSYSAAKEVKRQRAFIKREFRNSIFIILGILSAGFGLESFLLPNKFIDGGVTGISLLITALTNWPLPLLIICLNIPFIYLGFNQVNRNFAFKTMFAIAGLALCITYVHYPIVTSDKLLVSVFGGAFLGAGIGLAMRGGGVLDGTEVLALYVSRKSGITIGDVILIVNVIIFSAAAVVLSVETALYSVLTYLSASKTIDFIIEGIEEYLGVTIISVHTEEMRLMIIEKMGRGVTIYQGKRGFAKQGEKLHEMDIVFTVITRLEIAKLNAEIERIDRNAFVVMSSIKDTKGGMIKKRPLKH
ncbi:YitT family protein [Adhaeribacter aquaticus]|uniref:YitT family protein n=1 Tax=Adhaeribacter aquaticus TaxID=299567 RepID=UPI0004213B42|nr:YitT family protein [Adhaeribacter aquaticus]